LESILGIPVEQAEPTATWWQERVHPEDAANSSLNIMPALASDRNSFETEYRIRHADGHWVHASDRGFIIRDEEGRPVRVVGSTHNISTRKLLELELKENNKRLRFQVDILAATSDAVIAVDPAFRITHCNGSAEQGLWHP
jgi:PAS domain S-box-containing protein